MNSKEMNNNALYEDGLPVFTNKNHIPEDFKPLSYLEKNGLKPSQSHVGYYKKNNNLNELYHVRDCIIEDNYKYFFVKSEKTSKEGLPIFNSIDNTPECLKSNAYLERHGLKHDGVVCGLYRNKYIQYDLYRKDNATVVDSELFMNPKPKRIKDNSKKTTNTSSNNKSNTLNSSWEYYENEWKFNTDKYVILDTETTGLNEDDQVIQLTIIDLNGKALINSYFYTEQPVHWAAQKVHKISNETIKNAPLWTDKWDEVSEILKNKIVLAHNKSFDLRLIEQTCKRNNVEIDFDIESICTLEYSRYKYSIGKLSDVARHLGVTINENELHNSLVDCNLCLHVINPESDLFSIREKAEKYFNLVCNYKIKNGDKDGFKKGLTWIKNTFNITEVNFRLMDFNTCSSIIKALEKAYKFND